MTSIRPSRPEGPKTTAELYPVGEVDKELLYFITQAADSLEASHSPPFSRTEFNEDLAEVDELLGSDQVRGKPILTVVYKRELDRSGNVENAQRCYSFRIDYSDDAKGMYSTSAVAGRDVEEAVQGVLELDAIIEGETTDPLTVEAER